MVLATQKSRTRHRDKLHRKAMYMTGIAWDDLAASYAAIPINQSWV